MKKQVLTSGIFFVLISFFSCNTKQQEVNNSNYILSVKDSLEVVRGVFNATENFAEANDMINAEGVANFWLNSPDFIFVENTTLHLGFDAIYKNCINFYSVPIDSTKLIWTERKILPVSKNLAHLYGRYNFYIRFKSGEIIHGSPYYSAIMKLDNGGWKVLRGHESYELSNN